MICTHVWLAWSIGRPLCHGMSACVASKCGRYIWLPLQRVYVRLGPCIALIILGRRETTEAEGALLNWASRLPVWARDFYIQFRVETSPQALRHVLRALRSLLLLLEAYVAELEAVEESQGASAIAAP